MIFDRHLGDQHLIPSLAPTQVGPLVFDLAIEPQLLAFSDTAGQTSALHCVVQGIIIVRVERVKVAP
jgi:hypothetical protein